MLALATGVRLSVAGEPPVGRWATSRGVTLPSSSAPPAAAPSPAFEATLLAQIPHSKPIFAHGACRSGDGNSSHALVEHCVRPGSPFPLSSSPHSPRPVLPSPSPPSPPPLPPEFAASLTPSNPPGRRCPAPSSHNNNSARGGAESPHDECRTVLDRRPACCLASSSGSACSCPGRRARTSSH